jgi:peptide/nickel transport system permease protein
MGMIRVGVRKLVEGLLTLVVVSMVIFLVGHLTGNPAYALAAADATPADIAKLTRQLGLDAPLWHQYVTFVGHAVHGNFGVSFASNQPVSTILRKPMVASFKLAVLAICFAVAVAFPLGVLAAVRRGSIWDRAAVLGATIGQACPSFMVGLLAIIVFAVHLRWLPAGGYVGWKAYVLPAVTLGLVLASGLLRLLRSGMIEAMESDYVRFGRSLGLRERELVWRWALRNAVVPVVAFMSFSFAVLIGGAIAVEVVFSYPGVGQLAFLSVLSRDYPTMQAIVVIWAALVMAISMATDVVYRVIDPRTRD